MLWDDELIRPPRHAGRNQQHSMTHSAPRGSSGDQSQSNISRVAVPFYVAVVEPLDRNQGGGTPYARLPICLQASVDRQRRLFPRVFVVAAVAFEEVRRMSVRRK